MITVNLIEVLVILNTVMLAGLLLYIFKQNYKIVDMETYNSMMEIVEEYAKGQEETQELAGGTGVAVGFGADYLEEEPDEGDEDE